MTAKNGAAALANADAAYSYETGMCLKFVRTCWEIGSFYGSAIDAWRGAAHKHEGDRNPPKGAPMFYSGGNYGHIVIARGDEGGRMRSTDCQSSGRVDNADLPWPEVNWNSSYLGWASDLNGVDLPLGEPAENEDEEMPQYDHATSNGPLHIPAGDWVGITWENVPAGDAFAPGSKSAALAGRRYSAVVSATFDAPEGSTIRMRTVEIADGETVETNPQTEFVATSGGSYAQHVQTGGVGAGRRWAVRVSCSAAATLTFADAAVLSWAV